MYFDDDVEWIDGSNVNDIENQRRKMEKTSLFEDMALIHRYQDSFDYLNHLQFRLENAIDNTLSEIDKFEFRWRFDTPPQAGLNWLKRTKFALRTFKRAMDKTEGFLKRLRHEQRQKEQMEFNHRVNKQVLAMIRKEKLISSPKLTALTREAEKTVTDSERESSDS